MGRSCLMLIGTLMLACLVLHGQDTENMAIRQWRDAVAKAEGDSSRLAAMIELSETLFFFGKSEEAAQLDTAIHDLSVKANLPFGKARAMLNFCNAQDRLGNFDRAMEYLKQGLEISEEIGYDIGTCRLILERGAIYEKMGEHIASERDVMDGLALALKINYHHGVALAYNTIAIVKAKSGNLEESKADLHKSITAYQQTHKTFELKSPYSNIGQVYDMMGDPDKASEFFSKAMNINRSFDNELGMATQLNNIGGIYQRQGDLPRALEHYQKSLDILEAYQSYSRIFYVYGSVGMIYMRQKKYELAMEYFQKGIKLGIEQNNREALAVGYGHVAELLSEQGHYRESTNYYLKALALTESQGQLSKINTLFDDIGDNYLKLDMYDSAKYYFQEALKVGKQHQLTRVLAPASLGLATVYLHQRDLTRSKQHAREALKNAEAQMNRQRISDAAKILSDIAYQEGDFKNAFSYHKLYSEQKDSILNENSIQKLTELRMQYEFDREKKEIDLEQQQKELAFNDELERQKAIQYATIGGGILFIILAVIFYRSYRRKRLDNARIQEQADQLAFSNEQLQELSSFKEGLTHMIAHDMKNSLNVILGLSENESEEKMKQIHQSGGQLLSLVLNMLDIQKFEEAQIHLNPSKQSIQKLISEAILQVELLAYSEGLTIERELDDAPLVHCNESLIVRVLVNLLTNAIKYSRGQSSIKITSSQNSTDTLTISIIDYGSGIHEDDLPHVFDKFWQTKAKQSGQVTSTGLGLTFCKLAIEAHGGNIHVASNYGQGSTFTFTLPLKTMAEPEASQGKLVVQEEQSLVEELSQELRKLQVYQAGEIFRILNRDEARNMQSPWAQELRMAVEQSDTEKYRQLVDLEAAG
ncbi:MAG: tetratricopeptide repeat protein [Cytophagales bacterium]|nr:tetratricopeptide repeat protein [Cytophagales bacterium]